MACERKLPHSQRLHTVIILALFANLGFAPSILALTETLPLTTYRILFEADYGGEKIDLYLCPNSTTLIKSVPATFAQDLGVEGMGKLLDGTIVLDEGNDPQCADVYSKNRFPFGIGNVDNALAPFLSVASSSIPFGSTAFIKQLQNLTLPSGQIHNGCVRSDDTCDDSEGDCLVLYTYTKNDTFKQLFPTVDVTHPSACALLDYSLPNLTAAAPLPSQLSPPQTPPIRFPSPSQPPKSQPPKSHGTSLPLAVSVSLAGGALLVILLCGCVVLLILRRVRHPKQAKSEMFDGLQVYSYAELQAATSGFRDVLGDGASAQVYRATLDGRLVAVKKLKKEADRKSSHKEFTAEARGLGQMIHVNLVRLLGYSNDQNRPRMLVYEFVNGGTLDSLLHGTKGPPISFERRLSIALGIALGIEYCHHSIETAIIHRDIKPANILMTAADDTGIPKVADFGLARLLDPLDRSSNKFLSLQARLELQQANRGVVNHKAMDAKVLESTSSNSASSITVEMPLSSPSVSIDNVISPQVSASSVYGSAYEYHSVVDIPQHHITCVAGTLGYIDPEYLQTLHPTLKSDVYSFGIVLLELITGQRPPGIYSHLSEWKHEQVENRDGHGLNIGGGNTYELLLGGLLKRGEEAVASKIASTLCQQNLDPHRVFEAVRIASLCLQNKGRMRPSMRKVVRMLEKLHESRDKENQTTSV